MNAEYITRPGDRWDLIAFKAYGTVGDITLSDGRRVNAMSFLSESNPDINNDSVLDEGLLLQVPFIPGTGVSTDKDSLPPWKK
nr:hypothetical protein [uncultured Chitinophaga sp.]